MGRGIVEVDIRVPLQPHVSLRLVSGQVVQDYVDFLARMLCHNGVHKVEELGSPAAPVVLAGDLPGSDMHRGEQGVVPFRL